MDDGLGMVPTGIFVGPDHQNWSMAPPLKAKILSLTHGFYGSFVFQNSSQIYPYANLILDDTVYDKREGNELLPDFRTPTSPIRTMRKFNSTDGGDGQ